MQFKSDISACEPVGLRLFYEANLQRKGKNVFLQGSGSAFIFADQLFNKTGAMSNLCSCCSVWAAVAAESTAL